MNNSGKNSSTIIWILLVIGLAVALWLAFRPSSNSMNTSSASVQEPPAEYPVEVYDGPGSEIQSKETNYTPQHSEDNPRMESVDPFTSHRDFETVLKSGMNKMDFDFDFGDQQKAKEYKLVNGEIDFKLEGTLKTRTNLEDNVALSVEFCKNDQLSFTKRKAFQSFDLPFIKEAEAKSKDDKNLYTFDFNKKLESLEPGLFYFLIVPTGRNRVMYVGKFTAR